MDSSTVTTLNRKTTTRHLRRESHRRGGKALKRSLADLSQKATVDPNGSATAKP